MGIIVYCIAAVFVGILLWFVTKKNVKHGPTEQTTRIIREVTTKTEKKRKI